MKGASKANPDRAVRRVSWAPHLHEHPSLRLSVDARLRLAAQNAAQARKAALDKPDIGYDLLRPDGSLATADPQAADEVARGLEALRIRFSQ